jgi:hypothetical protein
VPHAQVRRPRHASPVHGSSDPVTAAHSTVSVCKTPGQCLASPSSGSRQSLSQSSPSQWWP